MRTHHERDSICIDPDNEIVWTGLKYMWGKTCEINAIKRTVELTWPNLSEQVKGEIDIMSTQSGCQTVIKMFDMKL